MSGIFRLAQGNNIYDGLPDPAVCRVNAENLLMPCRNVFGHLADSEALFKRQLAVEWEHLSEEAAQDIADIITSGRFSVILNAAQGGCSPCGDYVCEDYVSSVTRVKAGEAEYSLSVSAREV
ncbi:MAG: hypothetical protein IKX84_03895 [Clostridia bacterium]|nr:hypothetical protein [Clostridia bacterium]